MTVLSVNLNKIALLRNSRGHDYPNVLHMAERSLKLGAGGVTVHPRPDARHATYEDVRRLRTWIKTFPDCELNVEGYPSESFLDLIEETAPHQCTLVPDADNQLTSDHGWDLPKEIELLKPMVSKIKEAGVRVSIFIDANPKIASLAKETGTDRVELYTGPYAEDFSTAKAEVTMASYQKTAQTAFEAGLGINAGHDLDLNNLAPLLKRIPKIEEVSIGHALTVEALDLGWDETIRRYLEITNASK
ncbi:MAG: pyridoxine 5'-phosphate synthase [Verrucomicrobiota bacterium]